MNLLAPASVGLLLAALATVQGVELPCTTLAATDGCIECMGAATPQQCYLCSHKQLPVYDRGIITSVSEVQGERPRGAATGGRIRAICARKR